MGFNKQEVSEFFDTKDDSFDEAGVSSFFDEKESIPVQTDPIIGAIGGEPTTGDPSLPLEDMAPTPVYDRPDTSPQQGGLTRQAGDMASAFNRDITGLLGLPGDVINSLSAGIMQETDPDEPFDKMLLLTDPPKALAVALNKANIDLGLKRIPGSPEMGELTDAVNITRPNDDQSIGGRAGKYMSMGLTFLLPIFHLGRAAETNKLAGGISEYSPGMVKGVAERMSMPFVTGSEVGLSAAKPGMIKDAVRSLANSNTAFAGELTGSALAGGVSKAVEDRYGKTKGDIAGALAPIPNQAILSAITRLPSAVSKSLFPYTKEGAKVKTGQALAEVAESSPAEVLKKIEVNETQTLKEANLSAAKLSEDAHLIAVERDVIAKNSKLSHEFQQKDEALSALIRQEMDDLGGDVPIEKTQAYVRGRIERVKDAFNAKIDNTIRDAQQAMPTFPPQARRAAVNTDVSEKVVEALRKARAHETKMWEKTDNNIVAPTAETQDFLQKYLSERAQLTEASEMPSWVTTAFGNMDKKGVFKSGTQGSETAVKEISKSRTRINNLIRDERAKEAPQWDKIHVWDELQEAMLGDLMNSPQAKQIEEAIGVSRDLNKQFRGGIMGVILGQDKNGGKLAPEISLGTLSGNPNKAAVSMKRLIEADPNNAPLLEELVKLNFYLTPSLKNKADNMKINVNSANQWMDKNTATLELFPKLRGDIQNAINKEQLAIGTLKSAKASMAGIKGTLAARIATAKPKSILGTIIDEPYPAQAMEKFYKQSNHEGRAAIKSDIIRYMLKNSKDGKKVDSDGNPALSGSEMQAIWKEKGNIFKKAFSEGELERIDMIINTVRISEGPQARPETGDIIKPGNKIITYLVRRMAAQEGSKFSPDAPLQGAQMASTRAKEMIQSLDVGASNKLMADMVQDKELYKAVMGDHASPVKMNQAWKTLQSWMVVHAIESSQEEDQ